MFLKLCQEAGKVAQLWKEVAALLFGYQYSGSQLYVAPVPGAFVFSSELWRPQGHTWCTNIHTEKSCIHMFKKQNNKKKSLK